jgi:predicted AlkP superfamily pyrophosphatase or phosphodiesterase
MDVRYITKQKEQGPLNKKEKFMSIKKVLSVIGLCMIVLVFPNCKKEVKPNILLITIDTLRRDRLGCYGYTLNTSPFMDQLAREGLIFKHAVTPIPFTAPSHASILTSLHPMTHRVMRNATALNARFVTTPEVLKENGYYTIGAVAVRTMSSEYNFSQGFDSFSDQWDPEIKDWKEVVKDFPGKSQRVAKSVNISLKEQIKNYLGKHKNKPFFIWAHYYDPHLPYIDREDIVLNVKRKQWIQYDKEVRYTDNYIKELYRFLEEKGLTEKLVTCITADHGEQLGEHGFGAQHYDFYSETTFVPLIFHGFKIPKNKIVQELVSTMDIGVTLLKLVNLDYKKPTDGIPLLKADGKPAVIPKRDQLIIGHPLYVRSLQLISFPYSYILNFDFFYKHWFFSGKTLLPEDRFKQIPDQWVKVKHFDKGANEFRVTFPYAGTLRKGMNYAALGFEIEENRSVYVGCRLNASKWTVPFNIDNKTRTATAFFPVTAADRLTVYIGFKDGAKIANLRYAFLSKKEFSNYAPSCKEIKNKKIFGELRTLRKFKSSDELYNLESDMKMTKNLLKRKKNPGKIVVEGKRRIYQFFDYYLENMKKIIGKGKPERDLTEKEKEMLKSLGYL